MRLTGGCLCGAVRFEMDARADDPADYCHCAQCRRASGAPVSAWLQVAPDRFRLTAGAPRGFSPSPRTTRWFCGDCGGKLHMTDVEGRSVGVVLGALDDPEVVQPIAHGWWSVRSPWFETVDHLPRYNEDPPYDG
jgi:hypothetical protein